MSGFTGSPSTSTSTAPAADLLLLRLYAMIRLLQFKRIVNDSLPLFFVWLQLSPSFSRLLSNWNTPLVLSFAVKEPGLITIAGSVVVVSIMVMFSNELPITVVSGIV